MVTETLPETEVQPEVEAAPAPETVEETTTAPEPEVEDENATAVLAELGLADVATSTDTSAAPSANEPTDPYAGLSPQEITKKIREEVEVETSTRTSSKDYQNYVAGVSRSFQARDGEIRDFARENGLDLDATEKLRNIFAIHNGQWDVLHKHVTQTERDTLVGGMKKTLTDEAAAIGLKDAEFTSAKDFIAKLTEQAKSGMLTESQVKGREKEAVNKGIKAYRDRLIAAGVDIPGVRALEVPNNNGIGGGRGPASLAVYNRATFEQRAAWDKADPELLSRLIARG